jgi:hypothetical protein
MLEITKLERWPAGEIIGIPHMLPVTWQIENPATGFDTVVQEKMTPIVTVREAWELLRNDPGQ